MSGANSSVRACGAGVAPASFPTRFDAKTPAGRRRHEIRTFPFESGKLHFADWVCCGKSWLGSLLPFFFALLVMLIGGGCGKRGGETIVVGSKNFTEQIVLAE